MFSQTQEDIRMHLSSSPQQFMVLWNGTMSLIWPHVHEFNSDSIIGVCRGGGGALSRMRTVLEARV